MRRTRSTIKDVAKSAGVSLGTASRALNQTGRVSKAAIAAVTRAAARLSYEPDVIAQSMRRGKTGVVAMLVSNFANPLFAQIIRAAERRLQHAGYALIIANTDNDRNREKSLVELFRRRRVDGLLLGPCEAEDVQMVERVSREYFPVVALDREFGDGGSGLHVDHFLGASQATRYLLNLGHRRIALLSSGRAMRPGHERIRGFNAAFAEQGLKADAKLIFAERSSMEYVFSQALALLSLKEAPTAFICLGTRILSGVLQALRHTGRNLPKDVSVISVGDTDLSQLFTPTITSVTWDLQVVGEALAGLLLKRLAPDALNESERIVITTQLVLRESCGPAPTSRRTARE